MTDVCRFFNSCVVDSVCVIVLIVCIFFASTDSSYDGTNGILSEIQQPLDVLQYKVYHRLEDVLAVLEDPKYKNWTMVTKLLDVWESEINPKKIRSPVSDQRQFPYIQIEGTQRNLRRAFCRELAKSMGAKYIRNIPRSFYRFRRKFEGNMELKRAYVALGNYVTSLKLKYELEERPVVMAGFWMNQAALYVAKKYVDEFPPNGSAIFKWPKDLEKPDIIFFHNVIRESPTRKPENEALLRRISQAYLRFQDPSVIELNDTYSNMNRVHMRHVRKIIRTELQERYKEIDL